MRVVLLKLETMLDFQITIIVSLCAYYGVVSGIMCVHLYACILRTVRLVLKKEVKMF